MSRGAILRIMDPLRELSFDGRFNSIVRRPYRLVKTTSSDSSPSCGFQIAADEDKEDFRECQIFSIGQTIGFGGHTSVLEPGCCSMILALRGDMTVPLQGRQQADAVRPARAESALANIYNNW